MSFSRFTAGALLAVSAMVALPGIALAQQPERSGATSPRDQADAQAAMERGIEAKQKGALEDALLEFRRAAELVPGANLPHRFAGDTLVELGRYEEAIASYETYLRIKPNVQDGPALRQRIDELRARYLEGLLDVECTPEGASVFVDDAPAAVGVAPVRGLRLKGGTHKIDVRLEGYRDGTWTSLVVPGSARTLQVSLERNAAPRAPLAATRPVEGAPASAPSKEHGLLGSWWFWTGVGVIAVGAGITAYAVASSGSSTEAPRTDGGTLRFR